jgi:hypothetical protein
MICIAMRAARGYHVVLYRATRLIRREDGRTAARGFDSTRPAGKGPSEDFVGDDEVTRTTSTAVRLSKSVRLLRFG